MKWGIVLLVLLLVSAGDVDAADYCVREGATGSNNGSDWTNAYTTLPTTFVNGTVDRYETNMERNATYYIADGTYTMSHTIRFFDAENGTQYIYIKKAIENEHGTDTGWISEYGNGQAIWNGTTKIINFIKGYYIWDGQVGSGDNVSSYGFRITNNGDCDQDNRLVGMPGDGFSSMSVTNITFSHTAISSCGEGDGLQTQICIYSVQSNNISNMTISDNFFEGSSSNMLIRKWKNSTIEGNFFTNQWSSATNHGQQISPGNDCDDIIFRNNTFYNSNVFVIGMHSSNNERWQVYNNIVVGGSFSAVFANADSATPDVFLDSEFHHNTYIDVDCGGRGAVFVGTITDMNDSSYVYNNLFYNCSCLLTNADGTNGAIVSDYNACCNSTGSDTCDTTNAISVTENPFVDLVNNDFSLLYGASPIDNGTVLSNDFVTDFNGTTRPQDGNGDGLSKWDMGAYEYTYISMVSTKAYYNTTSPIENVVNSTGYHIWNRTVTSSDIECNFNLEVTI